MDKKSILVENGIIKNIAVGIPDGYVEILPGEMVDLGWRFEDGVILEPLPPTPEETRAAMPPLTERQFKLGLVRNGIPLTSVTGYISGISDQLAREEAEIEWASSSKFERLHPLVVSISADLGLTPEQVDIMWNTALSY